MIAPTTLPPAAQQQIDRESRLWVHWRAADLGLDTVDGRAPKSAFARASVGGAVPTRVREDLQGVSGQFADDAPRFGFQARNGVLRPFLRLERAIVNNLLDSEDFTTASWSGAVTVTADQVAAPDGASTADQVEDTDGAAVESLSQTVSVTADTNDRVAAMFLKKGDQQFARLRLRYTDGTTPVDFEIDIDFDNETTDTSAGSAPTDSGLVSLDDVWFLLWIAAPNQGSGYTDASVTLFPAALSSLGGALDSGLTGFCYAWGPYLSDPNVTAPQSYLATAGSAVTQNAESVTFDLKPRVSDFGVYLRFVARLGQNLPANGRLLEAGAANGSGTYRTLMRRNASGDYEVLRDDDGAAQATASVTPSVDPRGRLVELLARYDFGADSLDLELQVDEAPEGTSSTTPGVASSAFNAQELTINPSAAAADYEAVKVGPLSEMGDMKAARGAF